MDGTGLNWQDVVLRRVYCGERKNEVMKGKDMKRILLISNYKPGIGGINAQVDLLQRYVNLEDEWHADIFSTKGNPLRRCMAFFRLLCRARQYDVLHIHACSQWGMVPAVFGIIAGKVSRKKTIVTYHGGGAAEYFAKHAGFVHRWLCRADEVVVLSGFLKEIFDKYHIPCVVIPNIVVLQPQKERKVRSIEPKFISIRHLEPLYNISCVLHAYEQVLKHYPHATLDILGQGSQRAELEAYVHEHNLTGVTFVGQVPNDKIYDYLESAHIMLSAPKADNMPVSILEAMNAGLLVISSKVGGVPYMIEDGETGLLFESENSNDLAKKMIWALEHTEEANNMILAAQKEVQKYSWEKVKKQLFKVYI